MRLLPGYDDPRVFETLVMVYKRSGNRDAALALGRMRKEEALPVLLDNYFFCREDPSIEQAYLLRKYPLPEPGDTKPPEMDPSDRDMIVSILVKYLDEVETVKAHYADYLSSKIFPMSYDDILARDAAYILAILYASDKTPAYSRKEIEARKDRPISCVYADYMYDSFQYDDLQSYVRFRTNK